MNKLIFIISLLAISITSGCTDRVGNKSKTTSNYCFLCEKSTDKENKKPFYFSSYEYPCENIEKNSINSTRKFELNLEPKTTRKPKYIDELKRESSFNITFNNGIKYVTIKSYTYDISSESNTHYNSSQEENKNINITPKLDIGINPDFNINPKLDIGINPDFNIDPKLDIGINPNFNFETSNYFNYHVNKDPTLGPNLIPTSSLHIHLIKYVSEIKTSLTKLTTTISNKITETHNKNKDKTEPLPEDSKSLFYNLVLVYAFFTIYFISIIKLHNNRIKMKKSILLDELNKLIEIKRKIMLTSIFHGYTSELYFIEEEIENKKILIRKLLKSKSKYLSIATSIIKYQKNTLPVIALSITFIYYFSLASLNKNLSPSTLFDLISSSTMPPIITTTIGLLMMMYLISLTVSVTIKKDHLLSR